MLDRERPNLRFELRHGAERDELSSRRPDEEPRQIRRLTLEILLRFQNHAILIGGRVNGGDLASAIGVSQRALDLTGANSEAGGFIAVDLDKDLRARNLEVSCHIHDPRDLIHQSLHFGGRFV